ncbi:Smr/MutS family protein [Mycoplasma sp. U97]|uniref:Smr/MutS family protein n=1 Tax=Mycoplasma tauri TaxID=547987 RepID=UPI001CBB8CBC|nr:Smr/MutS family protein [Mycoplasma tauri]MBZ4212476.1 Smr/MutS family protein [Mycoplasma tauri]
MSKKHKRNYYWSNDDFSNIIDLHGFSSVEALTEVQLAITAAYENEQHDSLLIITGKGQNTLKAYIEEYLRDSNYDYVIDPNGGSITVYL